MPEKKSIHSEDLNAKQIILIITSFCMVVVSAYMTKHYFDVKFPNGMVSGSLCDINSYFNCGSATDSPVSNLFGVPIALFGLLMGLFFLSGSIFKNEMVEGTNNFLSKLNFAGCVALFIYSVGFLGQLCPFCTVYYILSGTACLLYFKSSSITRPALPILGAYAALFLAVSVITFMNVNDRNQNLAKKTDLKDLVIKQYDGYQNLGAPQVDSPYKIEIAKEPFSAAPVRLTIFSDFQCPACRRLSELVPEMIKRYKGIINIQYFFYPLDVECNPNMKHPLHNMACKAAYIAACLPGEFASVHDEIFKNQDSLSEDWLKDFAQKKGVTECVSKPETKEKVAALIKQAEPFSIQSTPTMLVNGVKVEGVIPPDQLNIIMDELVRRAQN